MRTSRKIASQECIRFADEGAVPLGLLAKAEKAAFLQDAMPEAVRSDPPFGFGPALKRLGLGGLRTDEFCIVFYFWVEGESGRLIEI